MFIWVSKHLHAGSQHNCFQDSSIVAFRVLSHLHQSYNTFACRQRFKTIASRISTLSLLHPCMFTYRVSIHLHAASRYSTYLHNWFLQLVLSVSAYLYQGCQHISTSIIPTQSCSKFSGEPSMQVSTSLHPDVQYICLQGFNVLLSNGFNQCSGSAPLTNGCGCGSGS
jgi:hypothetical protein